MGVISKSRLVTWTGSGMEAWVVGSQELESGREVWEVWRLGSNAIESECETTKSEYGMGVESRKEWAGGVKKGQSKVQEELELTWGKTKSVK